MSGPIGDSAGVPRPARGCAWRFARGFALAIVILLVLSSILVALVATFDWNRARPWIAARASDLLQRPVTLDGALEVQWLRVQQADGTRSWLPWPHVFAHSLVIGNPAWSKQSQMVKVDEVAFVLSPRRLLARELHIPAIRLSGTSVVIERLADGRNNWTFGDARTKAPAWGVRLGDLVLEQGRIVVEDAVQRVSLTIELTPLGTPQGFDEILRSEEAAVRSASAQTIGENAARKFRDAAATTQETRKLERRSNRAYEFAWTATGSYRGSAIEGSGRSGGILALGNAQDPFPLQARIRSGSTRIAFVGTLTNPSNLDALDLRLWLSGKSMADLFALTGVNLPETHPFATEGHLSGELKPGASEFRYEDFTGRVGGSDLGGSLTYVEGRPRGRLGGSVRSKLLQFADLGPVVGATAADRRDGTARMFPTATFRTDRWNAMDADVTFNGERVLHSKNWPIDAVETKIVLANGRLSLDPLRFGMAGGRIASAIRLEGTTKPLQGQVELEASGLELQQLLPRMSDVDASLGEINGALALAGTGNSIAALVGSSNGEVKLLIDDGTISKALLETAGLNIGNIILARLFGDSAVQVNCAASQFVVDEGVMNAEAFIIDTEDALIEVTGQVDLGDERYDLRVRPQSKGLRLFSLRSPLHVRGSLLEPDVGVDKGPLFARGAGAVLLAVFAAPAAALLPMIATSKRDDPNRCENLLGQMRGDGTAPESRKPTR